MSIILKGIDMPKKGKTLRIEIEDDGTIWQEGHDIKGRLQTARAKQIPIPHGDLIDRDIVRDECYKTMEELMQSTTINISAEALSLLCGFTIINNAPTIIESED